MCSELATECFRRNREKFSLTSWCKFEKFSAQRKRRRRRKKIRTRVIILIHVRSPQMLYEPLVRVVRKYEGKSKT